MKNDSCFVIIYINLFRSPLKVLYYKKKTIITLQNEIIKNVKMEIEEKSPLLQRKEEISSSIPKQFFTQEQIKQAKNEMFLNEYPKSVNFPCKRCRCFFYDKSPVMIPFKYYIQKKEWKLYEWYFCSFICAKGFIIENSFSQSKEEISHMITFYKEVFGTLIENIPYIDLDAIIENSPNGYISMKNYEKIKENFSFIKTNVVSKHPPFSLVDSWFEQTNNQNFSSTTGSRRNPINVVEENQQKNFEAELKAAIDLDKKKREKK